MNKILLSLLIFGILMLGIGCSSAADLNNFSGVYNNPDINSMDDQSISIPSNDSVETSDVVGDSQNNSSDDSVET